MLGDVRFTLFARRFDTFLLGDEFFEWCAWGCGFQGLVCLGTSISAPLLLGDLLGVDLLWSVRQGCFFHRLGLISPSPHCTHYRTLHSKPRRIIFKPRRKILILHCIIGHVNKYHPPFGHFCDIQNFSRAGTSLKLLLLSMLLL